MDDEFVEALDAKDGSQVWSKRVGKVGPNQRANYPGARSTPTVDGDVLYALGSDGDLACLTTAGEVRWAKNLRSDFGGQPGNWAYAESPLIDGDVLVCTPGGKEATIVALNKKTGDVVWKCAVPGGDDAAYASAIVVEVGGVKQYVQFLQKVWSAWRRRRASCCGRTARRPRRAWPTSRRRWPMTASCTAPRA